MKCRIDIPPGVKVSAEMGPDGQPRALTLEPTFYQTDAKPAVFFTSVVLSDNTVHERSEYSLAGATGKLSKNVCKATPVVPRFEAERNKRQQEDKRPR